MNVSAASLQKAKHLFVEDASHDTTPNNNDNKAEKLITIPQMKEAPPAGGFGGFTTGRGKQVKVSEVGLRKANALLHEGEDEPPIPNTTYSIPFGNGGDVDALAPQGGFMGGFQTGRGASIQVSKEGLEKANKLRASKGDDEAVGFGSDEAVGFGSYETDVASFTGDLGAPTIGGFQTGRGKKVQVSEQSLRKVSALFSSEDDMDNAEVKGDQPDATFKIGGFLTGRGARVQPSKESMSAASALFGDEGPGAIPFGGEADLTGGGFQTGRGRKVPVSEKALAAAHSLLSEDATDTSYTMGTHEDDDMGLIMFGNGQGSPTEPGFTGGKWQ